MLDDHDNVGRLAGAIMQVSKTVNSSNIILETQWQKTFGHPAPSGCHKSLLIKILAWQQQAQMHGGLTSADKKQLLGVGNKASGNTQIGTRLIRVWKDETHQVTVLAEGFLYKDKHWKSLSSIAREITGTPWSGPVFFGVKK